MMQERDAQPGQRLHDQREPVGQVVAGAAVEPDAVAVLAGDDAEAVVLDLVQPRVAGRRLRRLGGQARRDEAGREGHGTAIARVRARRKVPPGRSAGPRSAFSAASIKSMLEARS